MECRDETAIYSKSRKDTQTLTKNPKKGNTMEYRDETAICFTQIGH